MKKIFFFIMFIFLFFCTSGCDKEKAYILFNKYPFTKETITSSSYEFKIGERIYYLVTLPEPVEKKRLYIQIMKVGGGDAQYLGQEIVWAKHVKLSNEQVHYYTNYIVLNDAGTYDMKVYSRDNPTVILTGARFYVKK